MKYTNIHPGAILADERMDLTGQDVHVNGVQDRHGTEPLRHARHGQTRRRGCLGVGYHSLSSLY